MAASISLEQKNKINQQKTRQKKNVIKQKEKINQVLEQNNDQQKTQEIIIKKDTNLFTKNSNQLINKEHYINKDILLQNDHEYDEFQNFKNLFLGKEGAFSNYKVLIGFINNGFNYIGEFLQFHGADLQKRGFIFDLVFHIVDLNQKMLDYDIIWVVSLGKIMNLKDQEEYVELVGKCMAAKKGLFLWSDNDPLFWETNLILDKYFNGMEMRGNYLGNMIITKSNDNFQNDKHGKFDGSHPIFYGINNLHECLTICHPVKIHPDFKVIAYNSNNEPLILVAEENEDHGRIVLDTGFVKLYVQSMCNQPGVVQYISNANVWLTGIPD